MVEFGELPGAVGFCFYEAAARSAKQFLKHFLLGRSHVLCELGAWEVETVLYAGKH